MDDSYLPALSMAALEVLPAQASDLRGLLTDAAARKALVEGTGEGGELLAWLSSELELGRIETWRKRIEAVSHDLGAHPIMIHHDLYPSRLRCCWDAPPLLFVRGSFGTEPRVAVVGSRDADHSVLASARNLAARLAGAGIEVVSGLAAGIDTAAHEGALEAGGRTIAVMGTGISRVYPQENAALADLIATSGALVSQFAPEAPRTPTTFLYRNSVIAGLADVNVVMGGQQRSGSRHQAEQAVRYERKVLLWEPTLHRQPWAIRAVSDGSASFVSEAEQVLECIPTTA